MFDSRRNLFFCLLALLLLSLALHWRVFSLDLMGTHVWRQSHTQAIIDNFYERDFNILNPRVNHVENDGLMRMEFPLMQWLFALGYQVFGQHLYLTRIFSFIVSLLSAFGMAALAWHWWKDRRAAFVAAWSISFSPVVYYYAVNPLPDNLALCLGIWGLAFFVRYANGGQKPVQLIPSAVLMALSTATKLPFVIFMAVPFYYFAYQLFTKKITIQKAFLIASIFVLPLSPVCLWYAWVIPHWSNNIVLAGVLNPEQDFWGKAANILFQNLVSIFPETIINYAALPLFLGGVWLFFKNKSYSRLLPISFGVGTIGVIAYFLFELNAINTAHDYYLFPFLPFLFLAITAGAKAALEQPKPFLKYASVALLCLLPLTAWLRMDTRWNPEGHGVSKDWIRYKTQLRAALPDSVYCVSGPDISQSITLYFIHKRGWTIGNLGDDVLFEQAKSKGARYLYSASRELEQYEYVAKSLDTLVARFGEINIYRLK